MHNKQEESPGFTLIELMVAIVVIAVIITIAAPACSDFITSNRTTSIANQLVATLAFARSEAIKRGVQVTVKRKSATARVWEGGWDIFTDKDGDGILDTADNPPDELLKTYDALPGSHTLRTGGNYANWMAYLATGNSRSSTGFANDTFRLCDSSNDITKSRAIKVNTAGRVITQTSTTICP